jgi:very-short-patch-repair endonuclease
MDVSESMRRQGGLSTRAQLIAATSRRDVDAALRAGVVRPVGHGRYASPHVPEAVTLAHAMNAYLSLTSAALHHGWEVKEVPRLPHLVVPRHRRVADHWRAKVEVHRYDLGPDDTVEVATSRELTLLQCLRQLPDDEALTIADSALRHGEHLTLRRVLAQVAGAGRAKVLRIGRAADERSANPFESVLRAICLQVPGLAVVPQYEISTSEVYARADLVDVERRLVIEADSFEWHGNRQGFRKDVRRYTLLVAAGWRVVRFTWEDVMLRPAWVRGVLVRLVGDARTEVPAAWPCAA